MRPPAQADVDAALARITERLTRWGATKIVLFGSVARGDYSAMSDIDLIVVKPTSDRMLERVAEALGECSEAAAPLPVEPLVYTPAEFARLVAEENPLVTGALRYGRVLHDQA